VTEIKEILDLTVGDTFNAIPQQGQHPPLWK
jgi:hypothetical protein